MGECAYYLKAEFQSKARAEEVSKELNQFFLEAKYAYDFWQKGREGTTGHLTVKDNDLLAEAGEGETGNPITVYIYEYGYFVLVPEKDAGLNQHAETYGYSKAFTKIMDRARELKCKYIQYDGIGIEYEDLEIFDW